MRNYGGQALLVMKKERTKKGKGGEAKSQKQKLPGRHRAVCSTRRGESLELRNKADGLSSHVRKGNRKFGRPFAGGAHRGRPASWKLFFRDQGGIRKPVESLANWLVIA